MQTSATIPLLDKCCRSAAVQQPPKTEPAENPAYFLFSIRTNIKPNQILEKKTNVTKKTFSGNQQL